MRWSRRETEGERFGLTKLVDAASTRSARTSRDIGTMKAAAQARSTRRGARQSNITTQAYRQEHS